MLHAEIIGLTGKAPDELDWRRPKLIETAYERHQRMDNFEDDGEVLVDEDVEVGEAVLA